MNEELKRFMARNARVGDGCFWQHPESRYPNLVFTGTNKSWIEHKASLLGSPVTLQRRAGSKGSGVFSNSATLWATKSRVDPIYSEYWRKPILEVIGEMELRDFAYWYLDDGCLQPREAAGNGKRYRYYLCVGDVFGGELSLEPLFLSLVADRLASVLRGREAGSICKNNSKATALNRTWHVPVCLGRAFCVEACTLGVTGFERKLEYNP